MERMIVQHLHTGVSGKKPLPSDIMDGELAINYAANGETLFIKNSENAIVEFKDDKYYQKQLTEKVDKTLPLTYSELVSLRNNSQLIPGQQYRITDYTCTTTDANTRSAGHIFDIIVTADDENTLNEVARAVLHTGDEYFSGCNLNAWKLWYSLDNDTTRFEWADEENGKGVIYRMIDEFSNDIPYDFKNIQFKHPTNISEHPYFYYTFAGSDTSDLGTDYSLSIKNGVYLNKISPYIYLRKQKINKILFLRLTYNHLGYNCHNNFFDYNCYNNSLGNACYNNSFGIGCYSNHLEYACYNNSFGIACYDNSFGIGCYSNSFGNNCSKIKFSNKLATNIGLHNYFSFNHFGDGCAYILFKGEETASSSFRVQNYNFAQGLQGTEASYLTINGVRNRNFETKVEKDSNGNLKIFCLADLIYSGGDNSEPSQPSEPYSTYFIGDI